MPQRLTKPKAARKPAAKKSAKPANDAGGLGVGDRVPAFAMPVTGGGKTGSAQLQGKPYILYFYPKDDTSGCTAQACGFRDDLPKFGKLGATVIGVSKDSIASHEKFKSKYDLNFPLASDEDCKVAMQFGVWIEKSMYGRKYMGMDRSTFLIDGKGVIRAVWRKVKVPGHVEEVRKALSLL